MPRGDGRPSGSQRLRIHRYEVDPKYAISKKLRRRLNGVIDNKGTTWAQSPMRHIDPPDNTRMHRPGSLKK